MEETIARFAPFTKVALGVTTRQEDMEKNGRKHSNSLMFLMDGGVGPGSAGGGGFGCAGGLKLIVRRQESEKKRWLIRG